MKTLIAFFMIAGLLLAINGCVKDRTTNINDYSKLFGSGITDSIKDVVINEFSANSSPLPDSLADENGLTDDWIELYNGSDSTINFANTTYYITDDSTNLTLFAINKLSIKPGQYLVVYCDKADSISSKQIHTNFHLSKSGAFVGLYKRVGNTGPLVALSAYPFAAFGTNVNSIGLLPDDGHNWVQFSTPTPGGPNHL